MSQANLIPTNQLALTQILDKQIKSTLKSEQNRINRHKTYQSSQIAPQSNILVL